MCVLCLCKSNDTSTESNFLTTGKYTFSFIVVSPVHHTFHVHKHKIIYLLENFLCYPKKYYLYVLPSVPHTFSRVFDHNVINTQNITCLFTNSKQHCCWKKICYYGKVLPTCMCSHQNRKHVPGAFHHGASSLGHTHTEHARPLVYTSCLRLHTVRCHNSL